jgi:hypothetical protein
MESIKKAIILDGIFAGMVEILFSFCIHITSIILYHINVNNTEILEYKSFARYFYPKANR